MKDLKKASNFMSALSDKEKAMLFDVISENYYNVNFGNFSKLQMDLLMFSIYIDKLIEKGEKFDDYTISKQLGILQTNVRQLKKKKQLIYPRKYNWYDSFLESSKNAIFDNTGRIVISISDPNVYLELQHAIEEMGGYVEVQLNSKLLKIPPGYYIELLISIYQLDSNSDEKDIKKLKTDLIKQINGKYSEDEKLANELTEKNFASKLKENGFEIALEILKSILPAENAIVTFITEISKNLLDK